VESNRTERFTFGKYKGKMIQNICITDQSYIEWLGSDENRFRLSDHWRNKIEEISRNKKVKATYMNR
jgi:hypothetical protein